MLSPAVGASAQSPSVRIVIEFIHIRGKQRLKEPMNAPPYYITTHSATQSEKFNFVYLRSIAESFSAPTMLASASANSPLLKGCALLGFKAAYFHTSSICCEKRADKFRYSYRGYGHKDYVNYAKRKKRAAEKRDCLRWRSCEIYISNFEELYWSRGVNLGKSQKQWSPGRHSSYKDFKDCDSQFGPKSKKGSGKTASSRASRKDPFQFMWQAANSFYSECWGDFFHQDFAFAHGSPFSRNRSSTGGFSGNTDDHPGKRKPKVEPRTIGSPSDRQTLGLSPSGSLTIEELKKAFRASALKWHPDRHEDAAKVTAETKFKDCGAAYKSLLNALAKS